ncbi:MAG: WS/DGAT domain-containing protein, partial [Actinomycetota bacterium]|nr:WS/DGAT domain-containing protein [Actinomycetota bacterium]
AVARAGTEPWRAAGRLARLGASAAGRTRLAETAAGIARTVGEDVLPSAPACFLNGPIGPRRTLVGHAVPIDRVLEIKRVRAVSLNDVALAVVAGALRRLALSGGRPADRLKIMVPVSRRAGEGAADPGNQIAFVFVELPVHLADPGERLAAVHEATQAFKAGGHAGGGEALLGALGMLPGPVQAQAAKVMSSPRMYNLVVSNVPGPRFPVYLLGAECVEALPVIPLSEGHALSIGMFSLAGTLCFSGYADPGALPEVSELPAALEASIAELAPAGAPARRRPRQKTGLSV